MRLCAALGIVLLLATAGSSAPWPLAVGHLDRGCTVVAVRIHLLVTASHCVGRPGWEHTAYYYRGIAARAAPTTVVWDGAFAPAYSDLALLVPDAPWPATLPLSRRLPAPETPALVYGYLLGAPRQVARVRVDSLAEVADYGWMLMISGPIGPGNSGGPVVVNGEIVGVAVAFYPPLLRGIAVPAGTIAAAIRDLDRYGPMDRRPDWND